MEEKEYRAHPAQNYSSLAKFNESQDHALMETGPKGYFEDGKAFERLLYDRVNFTKTFEEKFFIDQYGKLIGEFPDDILQAIEKGEFLPDMYVYTQKGELNKQKARFHAWLDECVKYQPLLPVTKEKKLMLDKMVDNALECEFLGLPMSTILKDAEFQTPLIWTDENGIEKKCLFDFVATVTIDSEEILIPIDVKSSANLKKFSSDLKYRYWVQCRHYSEGLASVYNNTLGQMCFLAVSKDEPYLAQVHYIDDESLPYATEAYNDLSLKYDKWEKSGKPQKGWLPAKSVKLYFGE